MRQYDQYLKTIVILSLLIPVRTYGQIQDVADKILSFNIVENISEEDKTEIQEFWKLIKFLRKQEQKEKTLNGNGQFGFSGNQTDISNIFTVYGGLNFSKEYYPVDLDFSIQFQTVFRDDDFNESVSEIDISFDYSYPNIGDGLLLENFVFISRHSNAFLDIDQRYEVGGGFILNKFFNNLTDSGQEELEELDRKPIYKTDGDGNLIKCYQDACQSIGNPNKLTDDEINIVKNSQERYRKVIKKNKSKLRLSLLAGLYFELEKASASNDVFTVLGNREFTESFPATNKLRWEVRPGIKTQISDYLTIRVDPFFKMPMPWRWDDTIVENGIVDRRADYFVDVTARLEAKFTQGLSVGMRYKYLYDNAPKRRFIDVGLPQDALLIGQQSYHAIFFTFRFSL